MQVTAGSWIIFSVVLIVLHVQFCSAGQFHNHLESAASRESSEKLTTSIWDNSDEDRYDSSRGVADALPSTSRRRHRRNDDALGRTSASSYRSRLPLGDDRTPRYLAYLNGGRISETDEEYELYDNYNEYMRRGPAVDEAQQYDTYADDYNRGRRTRRPSFMIGKDRELFHASVDLKWMYEKATDASTWSGLLQKTMHTMKRLHSGYDDETTYVSDAVEILLKVRYFFPNAPLRVFQGSLQKAQRCAAERDRFVVVYIEDDHHDNSADALKCRRVLAHPTVGQLLNKQFIFMPMNRKHSYAKFCVKLLEKSISAASSTVLAYPLMIVLSPTALQNMKTNKKLHSRDVQVAAVLQMDDEDVDSRLVEKFLLSAYVKNFKRHPRSRIIDTKVDQVVRSSTVNTSADHEAEDEVEMVFDDGFNALGSSEEYEIVYDTSADEYPSL